MTRYLVALLFGSAAVALSEWRTDEDIITMAVLLVVSFALGFYRPRQFFWSAIAVGSTIAVVGLFWQVTGLRPIYDHAASDSPSNLVQPVSMLVLILPALLAAFVGRTAGRRMQGV